MKKLVCVAVGLTFLVALALSTSPSGAAQDKDKDKPKYTISEVMVKGHKAGLMKKVSDGTASAEEKKMLVEMYVALHTHKPPKGDEKEWKAKTEKMLDLAKKAEKGDKDAASALAKEVNCAGCHKAFRN